jgi:hypothetical protein
VLRVRVIVLVSRATAWAAARERQDISPVV